MSMPPCRRLKQKHMKTLVTNAEIEEVGESSAICNCCACACFGLRAGMMWGARDAIRSNFEAYVDESKCVACGQCVENCQTNALKLGTKLCELKPTEKKDAHIPEKSAFISKKTYNVNYRENRSDISAVGTSPCKAACPAHISVQA